MLVKNPMMKLGTAFARATADAGSGRELPLSIRWRNTEGKVDLNPHCRLQVSV